MVYLGTDGPFYDGVGISDQGELTAKYYKHVNFAMGSRRDELSFTRAELEKNQEIALRKGHVKNANVLGERIKDLDTEGSMLKAAFTAGAESIENPLHSASTMNDILQVYHVGKFDQFQDAYDKGRDFELNRQATESLSGRARGIGQKVSDWIRDKVSHDYNHYQL